MNRVPTGENNGRMHVLTRQCRVVFVLLLMMVVVITSQAITPGEVFEDGRRAFLKGHYDEAHAHFLRFLRQWPGHLLGPKALYFQALAECRHDTLAQTLHRRDQVASLTLTLKALEDKIPSADLLEMKVTLEGWKMLLGERNASDPEWLALPPATLQHWLSRGWFPHQAMSPVDILNWVKAWRARAVGIVDPLLKARLNLLESRQLWRILVSPLPKRALADKLKESGYFPLEQGLLHMLQQAFHHGDPETKKQAALLGLSLEQWRLGSRFAPENSLWGKYLQQRGIHEAEAWLPE